MRRDGSPWDETVDSIQEVFLRYFVERSYGRAIENPRAGSYRVMRNYLLDRLDRAAVEREVGAFDFEQVPDPGEGLEALVESAQMAEELCSEMSRGNCTHAGDPLRNGERATHPRPQETSKRGGWAAARITVAARHGVPGFISRRFKGLIPSHDRKGSGWLTRHV
jgi:hypothetical protein